MTSRSETARILERLFEKDVLDIHGVADWLEISRSSVNTLISIPEKAFPAPIYELRGKNRHPVRYWWKLDIENWKNSRSQSKSSKTVKSKNIKSSARNQAT